MYESGRGVKTGGRMEKNSRLLPLGVVGEKSFSDPTSDTWKKEEAEI